MVAAINPHPDSIAEVAAQEARAAWAYAVVGSRNFQTARSFRAAATTVAGEAGSAGATAGASADATLPPLGKASLAAAAAAAASTVVAPVTSGDGVVLAAVVASPAAGAALRGALCRQRR